MGATRARAVVAVIAAAGSLAAGAFASTPFTKRGTVTQVIDTETIAVHTVGGTTARVHVLGIDGPTAASCGFATAAGDIAELAARRLVWLVGDRSQPLHDRQGRLIAYVVLPGGLDLGLELIKRGDARVDPDAGRFKQRSAYRKAQARAEAASLGIWACTTAPPPPPGHGRPEGRTSTQPGSGPPPQQHGNSSKTR